MFPLAEPRRDNTVQHALAERFDLAREAYIPMVKRYAWENSQKLPGVDPEDLEVELWEVLWIACNTYDPNAGAKFNTYFRTLVSRRFADLVKHHFAQKRHSNLYTESLDVEAVRIAVEEMSTSPSAEEEVMARISVQHRLTHKI